MIIQINVTDKHAKALGQPKIVCGNSGYSIKFTFDAGWGAETIKTARFVYMARGDVAYTDVVFTGDTVSVPVLSNVREVRVGVFEGDLHTTTPAVIPCERSIRCGTGAPADPTPSQYDQIMALLNNPAGANPLTAKVGQTVIVKSIDENGKPTEWEATDYQPKTHWSETVYGEVLPLTKFKAIAQGDAPRLPLTVFEAGKIYTVVYDGTTYTCEAKTTEIEGMQAIGVGNDVIFGGEDTGEPFGIGYVPDYNFTGIIPLTDTESVHSVQITGEKTVYHKIPREYLYSKRIEFTLGGEDTPGYWYAHTTADVMDIINDAENGVFQYATITFPMQMDERTADIHLTMPLASHETYTTDDGITVYKAQFECEMELDKRYIFVIAIEAWPGVGAIISGLTKKIADSGKVDTAAVGQTIVVKSVDENGKPTAWEAADFPKWEKINEFSLTENALEVMIDADEDGNPFSLKKMMIAMDLPKLKNTSGENASTGYALYRINNVDVGYQNPSSDWDDGKFAWYLESMGDCIDVRCVKNTAWGFGNGSYFHVRTYKAGGFDGTIHSFLWRVFSPNIDKPSAMAGATFSVWGVRA